MRWFELRSRQLNDHEYIALVRKNVKFVERWRPWIIAAYTSLLVGMYFLLIPATVRLLAQGMELATVNRAPAWPVMAGFLSGVGMGLTITAVLWVATLGIASTLMPIRTDRLLLRYYDEVNAKPGNGVIQL